MRSEDFVFHDGRVFHLDDLVAMAKQAGSYVHAEHYLVSILYYAAGAGRQDLAALCDDIRSYYDLQPLSSSAPASVQNLPRRESKDDFLRQCWARMSDEERSKCLRLSLMGLEYAPRKLFTRQACWIGVYMVLRDRLDPRLSKTDFFALALLSTPEGWRRDLVIGPSTMSNYSRYIAAEHRDETYYEMGDACPWQALCERLWESLEERLLTRR